MNNINIHAYLYLPNNIKIDITGISDYINPLEIPIFLNFNFYQLSIINFLSIDKIKKVNVFLEEDYRKYNEFTKNFKLLEKINYEFYYDLQEGNNFIEILKNNICRIEAGDKRNTYILISPILINTWLYLEEFNFNKIIYKKIILDDNYPVYLIELEYFKNVLNKLDNRCKNFNYIISLFKNLKTEEFNIKFYSLNFSNLKMYILNHFKLIEKSGENYRNFFYYLMNFFESTPMSYVKEKGFVRNSLIGINCEINGEIEDSIIFKDVVVHNGTKIINSIILPGNIIGKDVYIKNSIIGLKNNDNDTINIGSKVTIGSTITKEKEFENSKYKDILPEGFALVGNFINLPPGFNVGKNCVIKGKVDYLQLKKLGRLVEGGTIEF
ncbi:MAG: hypothetical protein N3A58_02555 [Spirochaetes bacterium]|nr:hypothetical protein [Spirochaetota bacterium]